ncbi:MAG: tetratricopeptide repeat protein [Nostoc sp.]|uniref:tetratricopeptide repeat protein n=1 Tax=Nostoc sp. TaxID=1180 RepID=UPI002FF22279
MTDFDQALQISPRDAEIYNNRGNAHSHLGDRQGAMEDYQKATELLAEEGKIADEGDFYDDEGKLICITSTEEA